MPLSPLPATRVTVRQPVRRDAEGAVIQKLSSALRLHLPLFFYVDVRTCGIDGIEWMGCALAWRVPLSALLVFQGLYFSFFSIRKQPLQVEYARVGILGVSGVKYAFGGLLIVASRVDAC